jgi:hypothetical protein
VLQELVTDKVFPISPIPFILKLEAIRSSARSALIRATRRYITESYIELTGWALYLRRNVFPVRYELDFNIPENGILHSHRRENLKFYTNGVVL